ncbi:MAG: type II secretion system F family protein, partial [Oscillospiraceae bacterium]|nr:type II secretion system F family protein [Oscillospiraceae bacterium]
ITMSSIFPGIFARMVAVGFKTGKVEEVFQKLADQYEQEISDDISSLVGVIEPTLVALLSVVVGLILLSVMLPLMGIMSSIG